MNSSSKQWVQKYIPYNVTIALYEPKENTTYSAYVVHLSQPLQILIFHPLKIQYIFDESVQRKK